jgi:UDP-N-acetylmuramoyl-tripeptide--D-alanyl-D-alanine ligase
LNHPISDVVIDSRKASDKALFVALSGEHTDGHQFLQHAFSAGAVAALVDQDVDVSADFSVLDLRQTATAGLNWQRVQIPFCLRVEDSLAALQLLAKRWREQMDVRVIGVTGSVGKTTTKELTAAVLSRRFSTLKSAGNLNNEIGLPLTLLQLRRSHERAVLEMGFYEQGDIALLCELAQPHIGVITNVYPVHLERAGSLENICAGKGELVEALPSEPNGVAVLNADEPEVMAMKPRTRAQVFTYGLNPEADLRASNIQGMGLSGIRFQVHYLGDILHVRVPLLGRHSVHTALRAAAVGLLEKLTWQEILEGLQAQDSQAQLRLYAVPGPRKSIILDDTYNASPESTIAALNLLGDLDAPRRVAVLGDMLELGSFEQQGHKAVGTRVGDVADLLITIGERAESIAEGARASGMQESEISRCRDGGEALDILRAEMRVGDVVLVKGSRSMRLDKLVHELEIHP